MSTNENVVAIVLCGGLGTRLGAMTKEIPKPMMMVADRPFLERVLDNLVEQNVSKIVLAVSYLRDVIAQHFGTCYRGVPVEYSIEERPLGTGGAIVHAIRQCHLEHDHVVVLNGDSYCEFDLHLMQRQLPDADIVMVTKYLNDTGRYGLVSMDENGYITGFEEKKHASSGYINAGIYMFKASVMSSYDVRKFSFESDLLQIASTRGIAILAQCSDSYFIDIGIVDDYLLANEYFKHHDSLIY